MVKTQIVVERVFQIFAGTRRKDSRFLIGTVLSRQVIPSSIIVETLMPRQNMQNSKQVGDPFKGSQTAAVSILTDEQPSGYNSSKFRCLTYVLQVVIKKQLAIELFDQIQESILPWLSGRVGLDVLCRGQNNRLSITYSH